MPQYLPKEDLKAWRQKKKDKNQKATVNCYFLSEFKKEVVFSLQRKSGNIHTKGRHKVKGIGDHSASISTYVWIVQQGVWCGGWICKPVNCTIREDTQILRNWAHMVKITMSKGSRYLKDSLHSCPLTSVSTLETCIPRYPHMYYHT